MAQGSVSFILLLTWLGCSSVAAQGTAAAADVRVVDAVTGAPISGAQVTLPDLYRFWITDGNGLAHLRAVARGNHRYEISAVGRVTVSGEIEIGADAPLIFDIRLPIQPIELPGVTATVESTPVHLRWSRSLERNGYYDRARVGVGHHIDRIEIEESNALYLSDLFRMMPGVHLGFDGGEYYLADSGCGSFSEGGRMRIFVDGVRWGGNLDDLPVSAVEAIETYNRISQIPPQYSPTAVPTPARNDGCGVVLIWTG